MKGEPFTLTQRLYICMLDAYLTRLYGPGQLIRVRTVEWQVRLESSAGLRLVSKTWSARGPVHCARFYFSDSERAELYLYRITVATEGKSYVAWELCLVHQVCSSDEWREVGRADWESCKDPQKDAIHAVGEAGFERGPTVQSLELLEGWATATFGLNIPDGVQLGQLGQREMEWKPDVGWFDPFDRALRHSAGTMNIKVVSKTPCRLLGRDYGVDSQSLASELYLYDSFIRPGEYAATRQSGKDLEISDIGPFLVITTEENGHNRTVVFDNEHLTAALHPKEGPPKLIIKW